MIIDYSNLQTGKKFKSDTKVTLSLIKAKLNTSGGQAMATLYSGYALEGEDKILSNCDLIMEVVYQDFFQLTIFSLLKMFRLLW